MIRMKHRLGTSTISRFARSAGLLALLTAGSACEQPTEPDRPLTEPARPAYSHGMFTTSNGIYRIPYVDGAEVRVSQDHHTHGGDGGNKDRIDLRVAKGTEIVAAAGGWIRYIVDHNGDTAGRGDGFGHDRVTEQDDSLEHGCGNNDPDPEADPPDPPNPVFGGDCTLYNNYVWIEHPNGEWTKYTHLGTETVTIDYGWELDAWINAGEVIGLEDDIGQATGSNPSHLHYEVARPNDPNAATLPLTSLKSGFINLNQAVNLVPRVCDEDGNIFLYSQGNEHTANPCDNTPPVAAAGGPYFVNEGALLVLNGTGSSDPDGRPLSYRWEPAANFADPRLEQPTFFAGTSGVVAVTLHAFDQMEALRDSAKTTVTVSNVNPTVTIDPAQVTVIDENGTVTVNAEFTDPGFLDTHTATIDWGVPPGHEGTELGAVTVQVLDPGGPGEPLRGRVLGGYRYGDNDDGNGFTIEVTVTDSDGGSGSASFSLTVNNVDPDVAINESGAVLLNGVPTVVASVGDDVTLTSQTDDPGSDDLTLTWDWGDGTVNSRLSLVNPPVADPLPSPTSQPRLENDEDTHAFTGACLYEVSFTATDDDDGAGSAAVAVLIVGTADEPRNAGYWTSEYRFTKNPDFTPATLACYVDIVNHASAVFSEHRALTSFSDAVNVLWVRGTSNPDDLFDRQLMTAWLNFANGAYALDELVDTTGDGAPDTAYLSMLMQAEALRTNPARTAAEVEAQKDMLERLNGGS